MLRQLPMGSVAVAKTLGGLFVQHVRNVLPPPQFQETNSIRSGEHGTEGDQEVPGCRRRRVTGLGNQRYGEDQASDTESARAGEGPLPHRVFHLSGPAARAPSLLDLGVMPPTVGLASRRINALDQILSIWTRVPPRMFMPALRSGRW
jgi:hypothetical protein